MITQRSRTHDSISYAAYRIPLGCALIAGTDRGVCCVQFGESETQLVKSLQQQFRSASLTPIPSSSKGQFRTWVRALSEYLKGHREALELPLDIRGTAFQLKVWKYLQRIPYGSVVSYQEVARGIGRPTAARAVARACASNKVAVAIPCHRVLRGTGELGGYRWGIERKRALLKIEGVAPREKRATR